VYTFTTQADTGATHAHQTAGHHRWASRPATTALPAATVVLRHLISSTWALPRGNPYLLSPSCPPPPYSALALLCCSPSFCNSQPAAAVADDREHRPPPCVVCCPWEELSAVGPVGAPPTFVAVGEKSSPLAAVVRRPPATPPLPQAPRWSVETPQPIHYRW
jgi:hypothetical protein